MMKCQKCGAALAAGHLYCDACGAEYQIVPNFEPELELSMAETLSGLSEEIQGRERKPESRENKEAQEHSPQKTERRGRKWMIPCLLFCLVGIGLGVMGYQNTAGYCQKQAETAKSSEAWLEAASWYEKLRTKEPETIEWYLEEAQMYLYGGDLHKALDLGLLALEKNTQNEQAYEFLLTLYLQQEDFGQMNSLLAECQNENILQAYAMYLALPPQPNYAEGDYEQIVEVELTASAHGKIYYTLDGSVPDADSTEYTKPIVMGNGNHSLKAVYVNQFGVSSSVLQLDYHIVAALPLAPVVLLESGIYARAENIVLEVEEGTEVYYSTDGTIPTTKSNHYQKPVPMPLGESRFTFVAYSEEGIAGEVTTREYLLNIKTGISEEEAENLLVQELIRKGLILDKNGALSDYYGVHRYFYNYPVLVEDEHYYVFAEHYLENEINRQTGSYFAVDVIQGKCFRMLTGEDGSHRLREI